MACPTCHRTDVPESCGLEENGICACCGMLAQDLTEDQTNGEDHHNEEREEPNSDR